MCFEIWLTNDSSTYYFSLHPNYEVKINPMLKYYICFPFKKYFWKKKTLNRHSIKFNLDFNLWKKKWIIQNFITSIHLTESSQYLSIKKFFFSSSIYKHHLFPVRSKKTFYSFTLFLLLFEAQDIIVRRHYSRFFCLFFNLFFSLFFSLMVTKTDAATLLAIMSS
jgi:hypothetical protein